ncbi:hypothetical protein Pcinc_039155 [Petrolisthes cinctipes]|uniref:Uncharacterized protein n=1 Tax=Petrolisthes cinctipes TaxID=88211 RepID=A0AAE1BS43_PETCI|nr:hypothetical protein Pcinc_039155 [Petrolisthes cinctipes]
MERRQWVEVRWREGSVGGRGSEGSGGGKMEVRWREGSDVGVVVKAVVEGMAVKEVVEERWREGSGGGPWQRRKWWRKDGEKVVVEGVAVKVAGGQ